MNKRGIVLVFSLVAVMVLAILLSAFFVKAANENALVQRHVASSRAFWLAETAVAEAIDGLPGGSVSGTLGDSNYAYSAIVTSLSSSYYQIMATGTVTLPSGGSVSREIKVVVRTGQVHPEKFQFAIETTTDLVIKGSVDINPDDSTHEYATLDFADMFSYTKAQMETYADHVYTPATFGSPIDGITWVNVPSGDTMNIASNLVGSGILIVNGNVHFAGTVDFDGIIYVIGELTITGTVTTQGAVLAESSTTVDTELKGNPTLNYNYDSIVNALNNIKFLVKTGVFWKEI